MYYNFEKIKERGFSTLEILIAMTIMVMCLSTVILVSFGSQSMLVDSQTNSEAINKAQELLEKEQALARKDFRLVNPIATSSDGIYQTKVDAETQPDFFTKEVTATVSWVGEHNRNLNVQLSALVTNFENAVGGDTCSSVLKGDWQNPQKIDNKDYDFGAELLVPADSTEKYPISDIDVYQEKMYITVDSTIANDTPTFFVFDVSNQSQKPVYLGRVDNATTVAGISAVHVAGNYAYVASARAVSVSSDFGQLQIINISNPVSPFLETTFKIPGVTAATTSEAVGNSIFYKDGYVYLGLTKTDTGSEFNIIDVHNFPTKAPSWIGGFSIGSGISAIYVKGPYAYLETNDNNRELVILNISNPVSPEVVKDDGGIEIGFYNANGSTGLDYGKSLYVVGDNLYLGNDKELYILDTNNPNLNPHYQETSSSINGLIVRDYLAFLITTNSQFQIWNVSNPANITQFVSPVSLASGGSATSLDCEGNYLYVGSIDSSNKGYLSVISAQ